MQFQLFVVRKKLKMHKSVVWVACPAACDIALAMKKEKLVLDWRKRQKDRALVKITIETLLDSGLPEIYDPALYEKKTTAVYQHIYDNYFGAGKSVYGNVA